MVLEIPLQQVPNQTFGVTLGGSDYELTLSYRFGSNFLEYCERTTSLLFIIEFVRTITRSGSLDLLILQEQKTPFTQGSMIGLN